MGLLDDLRAAAPAVDPQFQPTSNEVGPLLAALIYYVEHGDSFLKAAGEDDGTGAVTELLAPEAADGDGEGKAKKAEKSDKQEKKQ